MSQAQHHSLNNPTPTFQICPQLPIISTIQHNHLNQPSNQPPSFSKNYKDELTHNQINLTYDKTNSKKKLSISSQIINLNSNPTSKHQTIKQTLNPNISQYQPNQRQLIKTDHQHHSPQQFNQPTLQKIYNPQQLTQQNQKSNQTPQKQSNQQIVQNLEENLNQNKEFIPEKQLIPEHQIILEEKQIHEEKGINQENYINQIKEKQSHQQKDSKEEKIFNLSQSLDYKITPNNQYKDFEQFNNNLTPVSDKSYLNQVKNKQISKNNDEAQILHETIGSNKKNKQKEEQLFIQEPFKKQIKTPKQSQLNVESKSHLPSNNKSEKCIDKTNSVKSSKSATLDLKVSNNINQTKLNIYNNLETQFDHFDIVDRFLRRQNTQKDYQQYEDFLKKHIILAIHPTPKTYIGKCLLSNGKFLISYVMLLTRVQKNSFLIKYMLKALEQIFKIQSDFQDFKAFKEQYLPAQNYQFKNIIQDKKLQQNGNSIKQKQSKNIQIKYIKVYLQDYSVQTDELDIAAPKGVKRLQQNIKQFKRKKNQQNKIEEQQLISQQHISQSKEVKETTNNNVKKKYKTKKNNYSKQLQAINPEKQSKLKKQKNVDNKKLKTNNKSKNNSHNQSVNSLQVESQNQSNNPRVVKTRSQKKVQDSQRLTKDAINSKEVKNAVNLKKKK